MSHLIEYCETPRPELGWAPGISDFVVGDAWFQRIED